VDIADLTVLQGRLAPRATGMVVEWAAHHQAELLSVWQQARAELPLDKIDPLP
jgi:hypothetical protein